MIRIILGVVVGFVAWLIAWVGVEKILSALWPAFGTHKAPFQTAITDGGEFTADSTMLLTHILMGSIVSVMAGAVAPVISGGNSRAPMFVGIMLLGLGLLKAVMSWPYVPVWYHVAFTAILLPMALLGGRLVSSN